jgi:anti-sigma regulatory factor (Ser/Thr protein kinase)
MHAQFGDVSRRHCLLPFEAQPSVVAHLRGTVGRQLVAWGAANVADIVTLVVSELATNVIRHVGAGTPAVLVLEAGEGRIRLELHDTSSTMPHRAQPAPEALTGRGLTLVAAMTNGWFAKPTLGGKAVCCELAMSPAMAMNRNNQRITRGSEAIKDYTLRLTATAARPLGSLPAIDAVTADLITDLLHWLAANGRDPDTILDYAQTHFEAEVHRAEDVRLS